MLTNFEEITHELTEIELNIIPDFVYSMKDYTKSYPITAKMICYYLMINANIELTEARVRKIINFIRQNSLAPILASSKGYYYSEESQDILNQIESLQQRTNAIEKAIAGLQKFVGNSQKKLDNTINTNSQN